jgi:zinc protease
MKPRIILLALALALVLCFAFSAHAAPQRHVLPSGLTVITDENHEAPVAAFQVWVRAGSAFERPGEFGITHLIEHMIFKGTPTQPVGSLARTIEGLGGEINAYTTFDHTNYYVSAASRFAPKVLQLLADAVVNASFDSAELKREKEVVVEEIRMNLDNPARRLSWAVMRETFGKDHPYGRPIIGSIESVRAMTRQNILDYRARWYNAPNMILVAVGDFKAAELLPLIEKAFQSLPTRQAPKMELPKVEVAKGPRILVMREKVRQASMVFTWLTPGLPNPEVYPLDMAAQVLGDGETSRLYANLKEKQGLVDGVSAYAYTPQGVGVFEVEAQTAPDKVNQAWRPLLKETLSIIKSPPKASELKRARVQLAASFVRGRQAMAAQARQLGYFEMFYGGFDKMFEYIERFKSVDAAQVAQTSQSYFTPDNMCLVLQLPQGADAPDLAQLQTAAAEAVKGLKPPANGTPKATKEVLPGGLVLIVKPQRALPLVAYTLAAPGGQENETDAQAGLYDLWAESLTRGAGGRTYQQLTTELEDMAASLAGFAGKSTCGLSGSFLSGDWQRGLELLAQVWLKPDFPKDQVAKAKTQQLAQLRAQQNSPVSRAFIAFRRLLYGDHPYAHNPLGTAGSLAKLGRDDLLAAHVKVKGPGGLVLSVVGDVEPGQVRAKVLELFGAAQGKVQATGVANVQPAAKPRIKAISDPQAKQTQIALGFATPPAKDPARLRLRVIQAILGGQGGRLFRELRDKQSLAYAVQPFVTVSAHGGGFGVYMAVGPGKEKQALAGLERNLERVRREEPSQEELERAKAYLLGSQAIDQQKYGAQAMDMAMNELLGLGFDYSLHYPKAMQAVTAAQVKATAQKVLAKKHQVELTLGPPSK